MNEQTVSTVSFVVFVIIGAAVGYVIKMRRARKSEKQQNEKKN